MKFGEIDEDHKGESWKLKAGELYLNAYEGIIVSWIIAKFEKPTTFQSRGFYVDALRGTTTGTVAA